jgi:hypothetical protein
MRRVTLSVAKAERQVSDEIGNLGYEATTYMRRISLLIVLSTLCAVPPFVFAQSTTYGVKVDVPNPAALTKATTYVFVPGQPVYDKALDQLVIDTIDRELSSRGVTKASAGSAELVVTYLSVRRTDVDLKSKPTGKTGTLREYPVGTLVVSISDPADRQKKLFNGRIDEPLNLDPATFDATIKSAVAAIFAKYPRKVTGR